MTDINKEINNPNDKLKTVGTLLKQDDVVQQKVACASKKTDYKPKLIDEIPPKKRKTRRGKSKRKYPYHRKSTKIVKAEAPYNSNQFLLEDHGNMEELDENLKNADQFSNTTARTRDSSFSVDSDGEFYSSPDDEEQFLIKDFVDQYESVQAERLQSMTKTELIQEYLMLEKKVEYLNKKIHKRDKDRDICEATSKEVLQKEVQRLIIENENLKRENDLLKRKVCTSEDSETDSSDSCCSSSSSSSCCSATSPSNLPVDYSKTNGHSAEVETA